jgi:hypothetical protein
MRILVACEFSGTVRKAFAKKGHDAYSCDLLPSLDNSEKHIVGDVLALLGLPWDMVIAHPPCTYLAASGSHRLKDDTERWMKMVEAADFFQEFLNLDHVDKVCVENPVMAHVYTKIRKPDQYIQPYHFKENASKKTGLWLKGLPPLEHTGYYPPRLVNGKPRWDNQTDGGQNRLGPSANRGLLRSVTYQGIADAMANQWSKL